jgi:myo-inositol-1(or 4)-monophosphatase
MRFVVFHCRRQGIALKRSPSSRLFAGAVRQHRPTFFPLKEGIEFKMLNTAITAAQTAGAYIYEQLGKARHIEQKEGQSRNLVSEVDKGAESRIISIIREKYPDHYILTEESGALKTDSDYKWIIDPLDGTTNFLHGVPIFCATVAVEYKGELIAGATYDPNRDELFTAEKGSGAYLNGTRLKVSKADTILNSLMVTGFPYNLAGDPDNPLEHFANFTRAAQGIRRLGSAALDLAYIASGRFDGYFEVALNPWDMAAGVLLVNEAGGKTTDFKGTPKGIYQKQMLATNGKIHNECLAMLAGPGPRR